MMNKFIEDRTIIDDAMLYSCKIFIYTLISVQALAFLIATKTSSAPMLTFLRANLLSTAQPEAQN